MKIQKKEPTIVSLLCGAGGLDYGFNKAGFKSILGIDIDNDCCMTYEKNLNAKVLNEDIFKLDIKDIPVADVILSSIITPGFSAVQKSVEFYKRNEILYRVLDIVKLTLPKVIVFESLKNVRSYDKGSIFDYLINYLEQLGYRVSYQVLNTLHYSIPQTRERLVIIGIFKGFSEIRYEFPNPHKEKVSLKEVIAIGNLDEKDMLPITSVNLRKNDRVIGLDNVSPALVIPKFRYYIKYGQFLKPITSKEAATIQSFPSDFNFVGKENSRYRQIVTSFPPELAYDIARELKRYFNAEFHGNNFNKDDNSEHASLQNSKNMKDTSGMQIKKIQPGREQAYEYEDVIFKNLEYIFDTQLKLGAKQVKINEGSKRIDIVFNNRGKDGFFAELKTLYDIKCAKIMIECKNYNGDLKNPDFDQLLGRFNKHYSEFGLLICRKIYNKEKAYKTCKDILNSGKGRILVLDDKDIDELLKLRNSKDYEGINDFMLKILDKIMY